MAARGAAVALLAAVAAMPYPDRMGDVQGGKGPDIVAVRVSNSRTAVTFRIRFASAPPLRAGPAKHAWADMLLVGIDVPPAGSLPRRPGGEWPGADFAAGTHGPGTAGMLVKLGKGRSTVVARFAVETQGATVTFSIPRRALGSPRSFTFSIAAARETEDTGGGYDVVPDRGTALYTIGS